MSKIAWTDVTWNPIAGCTPVAEGCRNCYAQRSAYRIPLMARGRDPEATTPYDGLTRKTEHGPKWTGKVRCIPERLEQPLHWRKPRRVFVNSMSDLFHPEVPDEFVDRVFWVMRFAPKHTFQVLTKRPERMASYVPSWVRDYPGKPRPRWPLPNVHLGYSASTQKDLNAGIGYLLQMPAVVRFLSLEPLLEGVDLTKIRPSEGTPGWSAIWKPNEIGRPWIDWVIVGGESGPGARRCSVRWIHKIVKQCEAAGVACFVKQLGSNINRTIWGNIKHRSGADPAEWHCDLRVQQFPESPA